MSGFTQSQIDAITINDFVVQPWHVYKVESNYIRIQNNLGHSVKILKVIR